ncbi:hypothetical protein ACVW1A_007823 [Bradyrhizobium sp. LB1.3]
MHRASGDSSRSISWGRTISGVTGVAMFSSASRFAAFSVSVSLRICRSGLASAMVTVCQP